MSDGKDIAATANAPEPDPGGRELHCSSATATSGSMAAAATVTIERQSKGSRELVFYATLLVAFDVGKLITSYALKYYNDGEYPIAQTLIVFLTEVAKLAAVVGYLVYSGGTHRDVSLSLKFAIPSTLYACTNNLYLFAFHYTTPAVWNILTQSRIVITALVYRALFKKSVGPVQWLALALLTFAISFTQLRSDRSGSGGGGATLVHPYAVLLALLSSTLSVTAAVFMEYTFKNDRRSFVDQQLQLSLYSALASLVLYWLEAISTRQPAVATATAFSTGGSIGLWHGAEHHTGLLLPVLLVACIVLGAACGLITGIVIKRLDNIVKIYSQALCGIINAIFCMAIFPDNFLPDWRYFISLCLVIVSIFMYEKGNSITWCSKS